MDFFTRLESIVRVKGTSLCVGLDPRVGLGLPDPRSAIVSANRRIVEATAPFVAAYKPNIAFYEAHGPLGLEALEETLLLIPKDIPVILDAKRCDIDATAEAYARSIFGRLNADAVTLSPYMGRDAIDPFLKYEGRGLFLLCRTSNPGAGAFQDLPISSSSEPLYIKVARECCSWSESVGLVVAGNDSLALSAVRAAAPRAWFLAPGIGAQGGKAEEAIAAGSRSDGLGVLVVAARSVAEAANPAEAARALRDDIVAAQNKTKEKSRTLVPGFGQGAGAASAAVPDSLKLGFFKALIDTGCFKLGEFVLKSGKKSPFYIDLRRLVSDPEVLSLASAAYESVAANLVYDRIAGIPAAALPLATAACLRIRKPMIWPRMPVKEHGTGNRVEGDFSRGERVLLLDDLITTGASKLEAAQILRGEGLLVKDLAVLIERGRQGRKDMEAEGIELHAFAHVRELFGVCESLGLVDADRRRELELYVDAE